MIRVISRIIGEEPKFVQRLFEIWLQSATWGTKLREQEKLPGWGKHSDFFEVFRQGVSWNEER